MSKSGIVLQACEAVGVDYSSVTTAREQDANFNRRWVEALEMAADRLEEEVHRRAVRGWDEPVFYQGAKVGESHRYSDRLLELMIRAKRPAEYKDKKELTGAGSGPLQIVVQKFDGQLGLSESSSCHPS